MHLQYENFKVVVPCSIACLRCVCYYIHSITLI